MTPDINEETAQAATQKDQLALGSLRLLGVVIRPSESEALLRAPDGRTLMVKSGEDTPFGRVQAVGDDFVLVDTGVKTRRLSLPA
ncbi:pilus assembly protein PilP [Lentibacter algarum]|uniref:pilus assembly protein PilP n=1 Tax=Lentibacter algarum TaxID=576131 RepID=UPI001C09B87D|nr:pilus assembly protein PilP [Lentibacter algarum]MBU2982611.1 pilus assembly protein PilP [Lentibacter algarum]